MSRTTPSTWTGLTPTLTYEKVKAFEEQYKIALLDQEKAGYLKDEAFYDGWQSALEWVLDVLHDRPQTPQTRRAARSRDEVFCECIEGPYLRNRKDWAKPRCGRCHLFVKEIS